MGVDIPIPLGARDAAAPDGASPRRINVWKINLPRRVLKDALIREFSIISGFYSRGQGVNPGSCAFHQGENNTSLTGKIIPEQCGNPAECNEPLTGFETG